MSDRENRHWSEEYHWATKYKHNDLFRPGDNWRLNACVGRNGGPYELDDYADGYFLAGRRLTDSLLENPMLLDVIIYPLVFTYRHAIELVLKYLAGALPQLWDEEADPWLTHRLVDNWERVKSYLIRDEAFDPRATVPLVDAVLRDFVEIDATGEAFRFPHARTGALFLQDTSHINVDVFAHAMRFVHDVFSFWREMAKMLWDRKREIEAGAV